MIPPKRRKNTIKTTPRKQPIILSTAIMTTPAPARPVSFTPLEVELLVSTWAGIGDDPYVSHNHPNGSKKGSLFFQQFYTNLFTDHPELIPLFPSLEEQATALTSVITYVVTNITNLPSVRPMLVRLGKRHARVFAVRIAHYEVVGNSFIYTLRDCIGSRFTYDVEAAWVKLYSFIADTMIEADADPLLMPDSGLPPAATQGYSGTSKSTTLKYPLRFSRGHSSTSPREQSFFSALFARSPRSYG